MIDVFSMFTGAFGFELGIEGASNNVNLVGYSQIDPQCKSTTCKGKYTSHTYLYAGYAKCDVCGKINIQHADAICQYHKPGVKNYGDATKINADELPDFNFLVGGFPCQPFSIAGEGQGFEDTRGTLFFDIARILTEKKPRFFLLENVEGLVSHDSYRTILKIYSVLTGIGYECQWVVLNSKNFGVPQNRSRVFFIGNLRGEPRPEILYKGGGISLGYESDENKEEVHNIAQTMTARQFSSWNGNYVIQKDYTKGNSQGNRVYDPSGIAVCQNSGGGGRGAKTGLYEVDGKVRRLTPIECERLQGWPDNWTKFGNYNGEIKEVSDSQRYKCIGNGVTSDVVKELIKIYKF
jgi:DNA (cytosine-5)-methyltransferase 1